MIRVIAPFSIRTGGQTKTFAAGETVPKELENHPFVTANVKGNRAERLPDPPAATDGEGEGAPPQPLATSGDVVTTTTQAPSLADLATALADPAAASAAPAAIAATDAGQVVSAPVPAQAPVAEPPAPAAAEPAAASPATQAEAKARKK